MSVDAATPLGRDAQFRLWAVESRTSLRRSAYLLCLDWHKADDLVQDTLLKVYVRWSRIHSDPSAYAKRVIVTTYLDQRRRSWRAETPTADPSLASHGAQSDVVAAVDLGDRDELIRALRAVPAGQRAVLVMRFWEDQSVDAVADALNLSTGAVKSQTSRGLDRLREELGVEVHASLGRG